MELRVNEVKMPEKITFNYEELRSEIQKIVEDHSNLVYTGEQIKDAKSDKASLNKLKKALNDERIRLEKAYLEPFNEFKTQINGARRFYLKRVDTAQSIKIVLEN